MWNRLCHFGVFRGSCSEPTEHGVLAESEESVGAQQLFDDNASHLSEQILKGFWIYLNLLQ